MRIGGGGGGKGEGGGGATEKRSAEWQLSAGNDIYWPPHADIIPISYRRHANIILTSPIR